MGIWTKTRNSQSRTGIVLPTRNRWALYANITRDMCFFLRSYREPWIALLQNILHDSPQAYQRNSPEEDDEGRWQKRWEKLVSSVKSKSRYRCIFDWLRIGDAVRKMSEPVHKITHDKVASTVMSKTCHSPTLKDGMEALTELHWIWDVHSVVAWQHEKSGSCFQLIDQWAVQELWTYLKGSLLC